jgi:hypothetical protein
MDNEDTAFAGTMKGQKDESLTDELRGLAADTRALAHAEFAYQKSRASYAGKQAAIVAGLVGAALIFLFFAVEALVFGAILALTPRLTPLGAMGAVTGGLIVAALACVAFALFRWKRMKAKITEQSN